jgi:hypothetical protein
MGSKCSFQIGFLGTRSNARILRRGLASHRKPLRVGVRANFWIKHDQAKAVMKETGGEVTPTDFLKFDEAAQ